MCEPTLSCYSQCLPFRANAPNLVSLCFHGVRGGGGGVWPLTIMGPSALDNIMHASEPFHNIHVPVCGDW